MATLHSLVVVLACLCAEEKINRLDITEVPASVQEALKQNRVVRVVSPHPSDASAPIKFETPPKGFVPQGGRCLALSPNGEEVAIGITNGVMTINLKSREEKIAGTGYEVTAIAYTADGDIIAATVRHQMRTEDRYENIGGGKIFHIYEEKDQPVVEIHCLGNHGCAYLVGSTWKDSREPVERLVISKDGKCLAIVRYKEVLLREVKTGKVIEGQEYFPTPDKRDWVNTVYTADGKGVKFDIGTTGTPSRVLMGESEVKGYERYEDSPKNLQVMGNMLAWSHSNSIFVLNTNEQGGEARRMRFEPIFHTNPKRVWWYWWYENGVVGMALSPDAKTIIALDREGRLEVWDVATQKLAKVLIESPARS